MTRASLLCLSVFVSLVGCRSEKRANSTPTHMTEKQTVPLDALSRRFGKLRHRMRERGYTKEAKVWRLFALEGNGLVLPLQLPTGVCTTLIALGGSGMRDLGISVLDADGEKTVVDNIEGEGALVHLCPQAAARMRAPHYAVFEPNAGSGAIAVAQFLSQPGQGGGFDRLFDDVLSPRVQFRSLTAKLNRVRTLMRAKGRLALGEPILENVSEGEVLRRATRFEKGHCYTFVARTTEGIHDSDLLLFDPDGAEVARDVEGNAEPRIEYCANKTGEHFLEARVFDGSGSLGVLAYSGATERTEALSPAPLPSFEKAPATPHALAPPSSAAEMIRGLEARGYTTANQASFASIASGETKIHEMEFTPPCTVIVGAAQSQDLDIDLYLWNAERQEVDRDTGVKATSTVAACVTVPTEFFLGVKAYGTQDAYSITQLRAPKNIVDLKQVRLEQATSLFRDKGYEFINTAQRTLHENERFEESRQVNENDCALYAVAGDANVWDIDGFLYNSSGKLIASSTGPEPYAVVSYCVPATQTLKFSVVLYRGQGSVTLAELKKRAHSFTTTE